MYVASHGGKNWPESDSAPLPNPGDRRRRGESAVCCWQGETLQNFSDSWRPHGLITSPKPLSLGNLTRDSSGTGIALEEAICRHRLQGSHEPTFATPGRNQQWPTKRLSGWRATPPSNCGPSTALFIHALRQRLRQKSSVSGTCCATNISSVP